MISHLYCGKPLSGTSLSQTFPFYFQEHLKSPLESEYLFMAIREMRVFCWIICLLLGSFDLWSQSRIIVVETKLHQIGNDNSLVIELINPPDGVFDSQLIEANLSNNKRNLLGNLRRFADQRYMMTLSIEDNGIKILSAYGLREIPPEEQELSNHTLYAPTDYPIDPNPLPRTSRSSSEYTQQVVELTNVERWDNGMLAPFKMVEELCNSSQGHSQSMALNDFFAHCDLSSGATMGQRITAAGYGWNSASENIAAGYSSPQSAVNGWMNSSGHRANILSTSRRDIGAGYYYQSDNDPDARDNSSPSCVADGSSGPYGHYWTQNFGRDNNNYSIVIEREIASTNNQTVDIFVYGFAQTQYETSIQSMRFSNDGNSWSAWEPYQMDKTWTMTGGNGTKTVYAQLATGSNGGGSVQQTYDQIEYTGGPACDPMVFSYETIQGPVTYQSCLINLMIDVAV